VHTFIDPIFSNCRGPFISFSVSAAYVPERDEHINHRSLTHYTSTLMHPLNVGYRALQERRCAETNERVKLTDACSRCDLRRIRCTLLIRLAETEAEAENEIQPK